MRLDLCPQPAFSERSRLFKQCDLASLTYEGGPAYNRFKKPWLNQQLKSLNLFKRSKKKNFFKLLNSTYLKSKNFMMHRGRCKTILSKLKSRSDLWQRLDETGPWIVHRELYQMETKLKYTTIQVWLFHYCVIDKIQLC